MSKHHSHELSEHPEVQWALDLLKPDPTYEHSVLSKYSTEIVLMLGGFAMPTFSNVYNNKPFYAGKCISISSTIKCEIYFFILSNLLIS